MGSWRKVGAFLGLVPDENHSYDEDSPYGKDSYDDASYDVSHDASAERSGHDRPLRAGGGYENDGDDGGRDDGRRDGRPAGEPGGYGSTPYSGAYAGAYSGLDSGGSGYRGAEQRPESDSRQSRSGRSRGGPVTQGANAMKTDVRRDGDSNSARPATVALTGFAEARIIGEKYRDGQSVILDMTAMSDADARRLVDFSAGLAFSLRGSIEKVAPKVFMLLPPEADVAGGVASALEDARAYAGSFAR